MKNKMVIVFKKVKTGLQKIRHKGLFGLLAIIIALISLPLQASQKVNWYDYMRDETTQYELLDENLNIVKYVDGSSVLGTYQEVMNEAEIFMRASQETSLFARYETYDQANYLRNSGYAVTVPFIRNVETGKIASCLNFDYTFPEFEEYENVTNPLSDDLMRGALYYGFDGVDNSLQAKYGISDNEAIYARGIVIWRHAKRLGIPGNDGQSGFYQLSGDNNLIAYIEELATKTISNVVQEFNINFDGNISQKNPQQTTPMSITAHIPFSISVTQPAYVTDINGVQKTSFNAGEQFLVQAEGKFIGDVTVTVTTEQAVYGALMMRATKKGVQNVAELGLDDPLILNKEIVLEFKGAYDIIDLTKKAQDKVTLLSNTVYEFADNPSFTNATKFTTDSNGKIHEEELLLAEEVIYIREYSAPIINEHLGYNISTDLTKLVGVGGETHTLEFANEKIKGKILINKVDRENRPLRNVQFDLLTVDGRFLNTRNTDVNGQLYFDDLELGHYKIVERTPDDYTAEQLVYDVNVKIDDELVRLGYNTQSDYVATLILDVVNEKIVELHPKIKTLATGENGEKEFAPNTIINFIDYVSWWDMPLHVESELEAVVYDKGTGEPLIINDEEVQVFKTFTLTSENDIPEVYITLDGTKTNLAGKELVVYEYWRISGNLVTSHEDINDEGQTIRVKQLPTLISTGQNILEIILIGILILMTSLFMLFKARKRRMTADDLITGTYDCRDDR